MCEYCVVGRQSLSWGSIAGSSNPDASKQVRMARLTIVYDMPYVLYDMYCMMYNTHVLYVVVCVYGSYVYV